MPYHRDFWLAVAAAAPLIATATAVAIVPAFDGFKRARDAGASRVMQAFGIGVGLGELNFLLQTYALQAALRSLFTGKDFPSASQYVYVEFIGLAVVFVITAFVGLASLLLPREVPSPVGTAAISRTKGTDTHPE